jgi:hypothetical protein
MSAIVHLARLLSFTLCVSASSSLPAMFNNVPLIYIYISLSLSLALYMCVLIGMLVSVCFVGVRPCLFVPACLVYVYAVSGCERVNERRSDAGNSRAPVCGVNFLVRSTWSSRCSPLRSTSSSRSVRCSRTRPCSLTTVSMCGSAASSSSSRDTPT